MFRTWKNMAIFAFLVSSLGLVGTWTEAYEGTAKSVATYSGKLVITGSSTMAPMIGEIGKRFQALHPGVAIEIQAGGSGRGISDVMTGKADIGMASRALTDKESSLASFAVGRDGICIVIHKDNPIQNLTNQQVIDVYTGRIPNWSKVGGRDAPITVMVPREGYSSVELFTNFFRIKYADIKASMVVGDNAERIKAIIANANGITFTSLGTAERESAVGVPIKLLPVDDVAATSKNVRRGNFPISRPLLLLTKDLPSGLAKEFINFSLSPQVTAVIEKYDFVPYLD